MKLSKVSKCHTLSTFKKGSLSFSNLNARKYLAWVLDSRIVASQGKLFC